MARKLASVLIPLAIMSPAVVHALGLGGIELNSFLNQPLDAQIEIISSKKGETDGMNVKLASPDAFARAGLEYTNYLRQLNFDVIRKSDGRHYIKVSTRQGFREPFLHFLLEVNWANGRILREYSELVDPPNLVQSSQSSTQFAPVSRPSAATPTRQVATPKPPSYVPAPASSEARGYVGDTYTTKRNDTAWQIAKDTRPDESVTVEQSMMALLRANPEAFIRQNVNRLKAGYTLNIPDRDSMLSQSHSEALAELRRQTAEWKADRRTATGTPRGRLEILPPQAAEGSGGETGSAAAGSADARREAMLAREAAEAQRQENAELRMRISDLEEQIENTKRLAQLKSDQLAALESKLAEINAAAGAAAEAPTAPAEAVTAEAEPAAPEASAQEPQAEPEAPTQTAEPAETKAPVEIVEAVPAKPGTPINQHVVSDFTPVDLNALPKTDLPAEPFKTGGSAEAGAAPVAATGNLMDQAMAYIKQNPMVKWIAAGAGGLLVVILGLIMARRRRGEDQFEESILQEQAAAAPEFNEESIGAAETASGDNALLETVDVDQVDAESPQEQTDTSFLSDMVLSDMSELQEGGEADPLTEADVFLAYGRYGPAENMIKGAIAKEPERTDLRLKLLEIYYSSKNREAFEQEAAALHTDLASKPDPETWAKVVEMGEDLCPGNKLFAAAAAAGAAAAATGAALASDEEDTEIMDFDLGEFEDQIDNMEASETVQNAAGGLDDDGLDLDLDQLVTGDDAAEDLDDTLEFTTELESMEDDSVDELLEKTEELEFDLTDTGTEQREITRRIDTRESELDETTRIMDSGQAQDEITEELEGIADVLKSEDASEPIEREITRRIDTNAADNDATQILDIPNMDELEDFSADAGVPMDDAMDFDDDALADIDEIGTKLDLARAYIDMGDPEGARSILDEVIEEGNDSQKNEAQELLSQI